MQENTSTPDRDETPLLNVAENSDGSATIVDPADTSAPANGEDRAAKTPDGGSEAAFDDELNQAKTDEEREAIRARRRQERAERRERRREREASMREELQARDRQIQELSDQVRALTQHSVGNELSRLDNEIQNTANLIGDIKSVIAEASSKNEGDIVAEATERLVKANARLNHLQGVRRSANERPAAGSMPMPDQVARPAPEVVELSTKWLRKNDWYNPRGADLDSVIVRNIDDAVLRDGYDPRTQDYWDELSDRVARYLPHRKSSPGGQPGGYNGDVPTREPMRSNVAGSDRGAAAPSGRGSQSTLSPDRVRALKEAGYWDDPKLRTDAIRRYQEYDRQAAEQAAGR